MNIKNNIKKILIYFNISLTKNISIDIQTNLILKKISLKSSELNCIDIGSFDGEILELFIKYFPGGNHIAFEPIPHKYNKLKKKFSSYKLVKIFNFAIGNDNCSTEFNYVRSNPAYSGLKIRKYPKNEFVEKLDVNLRSLNSFLSENDNFDIIKIDVEGGEYDVLLGASEILAKNKPILIFEYGKGAADFYDVDPISMYKLLINFNYKIYSLKNFLINGNSYSLDEFCDVYYSNKIYYFLAI